MVYHLFSEPDDRNCETTSELNACRAAGPRAAFSHAPMSRVASSAKNRNSSHMIHKALRKQVTRKRLPKRRLLCWITNIGRTLQYSIITSKVESQLVPEHCPKPVFVNDPLLQSSMRPCPLCPINLPRNVTCHHQACLPMTPPPSRCPTWDLDSNRWLLPKPLPSHRMSENTSETWQIFLLSRTFYISSHH